MIEEDLQFIKFFSEIEDIHELFVLDESENILYSYYMGDYRGKITEFPEMNEKKLNKLMEQLSDIHDNVGEIIGTYSEVVVNYGISIN